MRTCLAHDPRCPGPLCSHVPSSAPPTGKSGAGQGSEVEENGHVAGTCDASAPIQPENGVRPGANLANGAAPRSPRVHHDPTGPYGYSLSTPAQSRSTCDRMAQAAVRRDETGAVIALGEDAQNSPAEITDHLRAVGEWVYARGVALQVAAS